MNINDWGTYPLPSEAQIVATIGPLSFTVSRRGHEWHLEYERGRAEQAAEPQPGAAPAPTPPQARAKRERFIHGAEFAQLLVKPTLADRPIIIRPDIALQIPAKQVITLYVSSPLWVALQAGAEGPPLTELAIVHLSDTWFGPSTIRGELCYADTTTPLLRLDEVTSHPYRASTSIIIDNKTEHNIILERLNLPVPLLRLYRAASGAFWTQSLKITQKALEQEVVLDLLPSPPAGAHDAHLVAEPRKRYKEKTIIGAISSYFA